jgi:hypothetical protein
MALLGIMYIFYTFPITAAATLLEPEELAGIIPLATDIEEGERYAIAHKLSGLMTALIWSSFFALCPLFFKAGTVDRCFVKFLTWSC